MTQSVHDLLEQHFDTAFAAPGGIPKLRELILTLAMQGKLVEQDPNDPPASELLKEIKTEKQRLISEKKIKKQKSLPPIKPEEVPYQLPQGWAWVRLDELGVSQTGTTPPSKNPENYGDHIPFIGPGSIKNGNIDYSGQGLSLDGLSKGRLIEKDSVLMVCIGGSIGKHAINQMDVTCNQQINTLTPFKPISVKYTYFTMAADYFQRTVLNKAGGSATPIINKQKWSSIPIPLPPITEQHRIVARIDQLMARCDELEKLRKDREEKRLQVHAAAIKQLLDAPENTGWPFIQQQFGELYTVKENVAELRKAILQLAVMGRLVPQDLNDPPASELLKEIEAEKQQLVSAGIFRNNDDKLSNGVGCPFKLPQGWEWTSVQKLGFVLGGKRLPKGHSYSESPTEFRYLTVTNMKNSTIIDNDIKYISRETHEEIKKYVISSEDIYITIAGTIGAVGIIPEHCDGMNLTENASRLVFFGCDKFFLVNLLSSGLVQDQFAVLTNKMAQPKLSLRSILSTGVPIPPLEEQRRIVARVDMLMGLCDNLDEQIEATGSKQEALLNAVMAQV